MSLYDKGIILGLKPWKDVTIFKAKDVKASIKEDKTNIILLVTGKITMIEYIERREKIFGKELSQ